MIGVLLALWTASADPGTGAWLEQAWLEVREDARWRSPYAAERGALREGLGLLVQDGAPCDDGTLARVRALIEPADYRLDTHGEGAERFLLVREASERRGAGLFAVRCGPARGVVWQAPHAFHDVSTGEIVRQIFLESGARAAMWNTVHRYRSIPGERVTDPVHPADVTREHGSLYQAATVGLAVGDPSLRFVQVHGFAASSAPQDVIVSTGDPDAAPTALASALESLLGRVGAFGDDTEKLGATKNVQGQALRKWPETRFLHVELAPSSRKRLLEDAALRDAFARAVADGEW